MCRSAANAEEKSLARVEGTIKPMLKRHYVTSLESALSFTFSLAERAEDDDDPETDFTFSLAGLADELETETIRRLAFEADEKNPARAEGTVESPPTRHYATSLESSFSITELADDDDEPSLASNSTTSLLTFGTTKLTSDKSESETEIIRGHPAIAASLECPTFSSINEHTADESSSSHAGRKNGRRKSVRFSIVSTREFNVVGLQSEGDDSNCTGEQSRKNLAWLGWEIQGESQIHIDDHKEKMRTDRLERYSEIIRESMKQAECERERDSGEKTECDESNQLFVKKRRKGFRSMLKPLWRGIVKSTVTIAHTPNQL